jgi:Flp pilus assembly protein CpaB
VVSSSRADAGNEPLAVPVRRWWTRLSSAHILIFSAGALAFIANLAVLRPPALPPNVAVASSDLLPGTVFDPVRHVEYLPMTTDPELLARFVTEDTVSNLAGRVLAGRVDEGEALSFSNLVEAATDDGRRIMSLPIERERAAGGTLSVGDRIDVIAVEAGVARYVVSGVEVVAVPDTKGSFTGSSSYHVVLAVDAVSALELSVVMETATIQVIRSTGSPSALEVRTADGG